MLHAPLCREYHGIQIELEPFFWCAVDDIAAAERTSPDAVCKALMARLQMRNQRHGDVTDISAALTTALRVFVASYYREMATLPTHALRASFMP